jgi:hypothetical protein
MTEYVAGWRLKIDRAREHLAQLDAEILGFFASGPFEVKSVTDQQARFVNNLPAPRGLKEALPTDKLREARTKEGGSRARL